MDLIDVCVGGVIHCRNVCHASRSRAALGRARDVAKAAKEAAEAAKRYTTEGRDVVEEVTPVAG